MPAFRTAMACLHRGDLIRLGAACKEDRPLLEMLVCPRERALHFLRPADESVGIEFEDWHRPLSTLDLRKCRLRAAAGEAGGAAADSRGGGRRVCHARRKETAS